MTVAIAALGAVFLASCSGSATKTKFSEAAYGVKASKRVARGNRIPEGGGTVKVGKPYKVAGRTYVPKHDPDYSKVGLASWYGPNFHGRRTANGEVFDMNDLSAAHPTLPLPSYVRVTNMKNNRSVVVRVNDRGPFAHNRIIDVSSKAAAMLDFKRTGVAKVRVDYVGPARLDGRDQRTLMASYSAPGSKPRTMIAGKSTRSNPIVLAKTKTPDPARIEPQDALAPLILGNGFISSYADTRRFIPAHEAAAGLARGFGQNTNQFTR